MPRPRVDMRKIREVLRLTFGEGLSRRQVGAAAGVPFTTVSDYVGRAVAAGVSWPLPDGLDDAGLAAAVSVGGAVVGCPALVEADELGEEFVAVHPVQGHGS